MLQCRNILLRGGDYIYDGKPESTKNVAEKGKRKKNSAENRKREVCRKRENEIFESVKLGNMKIFA